MGLDMFVVRVSKPNYDTAAVYNRVDLGECIIIDGDDLSLPMYNQLSPYVQKLKVKNERFDMDKIRRDYNLSENSHICMLSSYQIGIKDYETSNTVYIPTMVVDEKYTLTTIDDCYVCHDEEEVYWRKEYEIQSWIHENIGCDVENIGFYILSVELQLKFNKKFPEYKIGAEEPDEESALFYHEWY